MRFTPSSKHGADGDHKSSAWKFNSPQVTLPRLPSEWPDVKLPTAPNSASKAQSGNKQFGSAKSKTVFDGAYEAKEKDNHSRSRKNGASRNLNQMKITTGNDDVDVNMSSSPLTLEDGSSERKERLKDATASQKRDKSTGKKKNREKGGSENVFNARSPTQEGLKALAYRGNSTPTQSKNQMNTNNSSTFSPSDMNTIAVMTEAQLQANLLRRSGHQEFSSHVFDASSEDEGKPRSEKDTAKGKTKKRKRRESEDVELDPVKAEIAKQQATLNKIMSERMKKNPDHYFNDGVSAIHNLSSEEEIQGGSAYDIDSPRSDPLYNGSRNPMKKYDNSRERKGDRKAGLVDKGTGAVGSRKKARTSNNEKHRTSTDNINVNADVASTLKSFWDIIPKALLHTTMMSLNQANRHSLDTKLMLCKKGKQTNPHIRIITRIDENGDEIELLEEYGKINEPDPYTMSSELTLLTAAKELIILLSGQRLGLDTSSAGETKGVGNEHTGERSLMEENLTRIAGGYQRQIDELREENRNLTAKLKKRKS